MTGRQSKILDLGRTFVKVSTDGDKIDAEGLETAALWQNREVDWDALLQHRYVVVLGEAGTGKTTEFRRRVELLEERGRHAFFVPLTDLAASGVADSLNVTEEQRLDDWRASDERAIFFLDSLDEAKLQHHSLERALRRLAKELRLEWERVHLVVSCRASDWMATADSDAFKRGVADSKAEILVTQFSPLNNRQVELLGRDAGIKDIDAFLKAVSDNFAELFIERPLDVLWLGSYWLIEGCIGSFRELVAKNVAEKLQEVPGRQSELTASKAESAVHLLAGMATLQNLWAYLLPDRTLDVTRTVGTIDPVQHLVDWSGHELSELLRRPIFDEATFGRVRIHHRIVQEYLTARWLKELLDHGLPVDEVCGVILRDEEGEKAVPTHLAPVAAWLALWDSTIREQLIAHAPSLLIEYGDPSGFAEDVRCRILGRFAQTYKLRNRQFGWFHPASIKRFSTPVLTDQIKSLLAQNDTPEELIVFLLSVVEQGKMLDCVDICVSIVLDDSRHYHVRTTAIHVTAVLGTSAQQQELRRILSSGSVWNHEVASEFIRALYPDQLSSGELRQILMTLDPEFQNVTTTLHLIMGRDVPKQGTIEQRLMLMKDLLLDVCVRDAKTGELQVRRVDTCTIRLFVRLGASLIEDLGEAAIEQQPILEAIEAYGWMNHHGVDTWDDLAHVKQAVSARPKLRQALFWRRADAFVREKRFSPRYSFQIVPLFELSPLEYQDHDWLADDARTRVNPSERLLAFDALLRLSHPTGDRDQHLKFVRQVAHGHPELGRRLERSLRRLENVPDPLWNTRRLQERAWELARARRIASDRTKLQSRIGELADGSWTRGLVFLFQYGSKAGLNLAEVDLERILADFGTEIYNSAVSGWTFFWKEHSPELRHEREIPSSTPLTVGMGLAGLEIDFANGLRTQDLSEKEVRHAARFALCSLNQLPGWLASLASCHPLIVKDTIRPCLLAELDADSESVASSDFHSRLLLGEPELRSLLIPVVVSKLQDSDAGSVETLGAALQLIRSTRSLPDDDLAALSRLRCTQALAEPVRHAMWWTTWFALEPAPAVSHLESTLASAAHNDAYLLMLKICSMIEPFGSQNTTVPSSPCVDVDSLKRLILLVYRYIKPEDDLQHEGGRILTDRDHSEHTRGRLINRLGDIPGPEAVSALRELAGHKELASVRDWVLHLSDQRRRSNVSASAPEIVERLKALCMKHGTQMTGNLKSIVAENRMDRVDVGIITMKEEEYGALLDKFGGASHRRGKNRDYDVVSVTTTDGPCLVAITRCAVQGNTYSQAAASELLSDLNPRHLLVVGIAGGVPTTDFCLGDVIVSNYIHDLTLEDTGGDHTKRRFTSQGGNLLPAATRIVERLPSITRTNTSWSSADALECRRPGLEGEHTTSDIAWNKLIENALEHHSDRNEPIATAQRVIASDRLVKDPELVQKWQDTIKGFGAIEMESAGIYLACQRAATPFMAIRGISDIVGWKRDEAWTRYACHTAAACTHMLVKAGVFLEPK